MEGTIRFEQSGHTAEYRVLKTGPEKYNAELRYFSGKPDEAPPAQILFIGNKDSFLVSSDKKAIVQKLFESVHGRKWLYSQLFQPGEKKLPS